MTDSERVLKAMRGQLGLTIYSISMRAGMTYRETYYELRRLRVRDEVVSARRDGMTYWWVPA
jgi:hypothetical protein